MINFTVGPVQSSDEVRQVGSEQVPYFRTPEFSEIMLENERLMLQFSKAPDNSRAVFMTCSGTGSMEASIINTLTADDRAIVVNGGSFGQRFQELCEIHDIKHSVIRLEHGMALAEEMLKEYEGAGYTSFIVNVHETTTGVHYDIDMISRFCRRNNLFLIVDAISSFMADDFDMAKLGADVMITGSQKALACPPGISIIVLSPRALERVKSNTPRCMYLDLKSALKNQERGQTPFTPAVGILRQINTRLREIDNNGGVEKKTARIASLAEYFRSRLSGYPFEIVYESLSNAVTPLHPTNGKSAYEIFTILKNEYGIWVCPNGGDLKDILFRVGHIGYLSYSDYDELFMAFSDMQNRGLL